MGSINCQRDQCYTLMWNFTLEYTQLPILNLRQHPTGKSFPELPHTPANAQHYDVVLVVVSQKLGRKCTVPAES